jgi:hypothetical protein
MRSAVAAAAAAVRRAASAGLQASSAAQVAKFSLLSRRHVYYLYCPSNEVAFGGGGSRGGRQPGAGLSTVGGAGGAGVAGGASSVGAGASIAAILRRLEGMEARGEEADAAAVARALRSLSAHAAKISPRELAALRSAPQTQRLVDAAVAGAEQLEPTALVEELELLTSLGQVLGGGRVGWKRAAAAAAACVYVSL